jgi:A/G-specific adenine glycosylase
LRKCGEGERWAGLWDFPRFAVSKGGKQIADGVRWLTGVRVARPRQIATLRHGVTRFRITLNCYLAKRAGTFAPQNHQRRANGDAEQRWVNPNELTEYPLSSTGRKIARLLAASMNDV